MPRIGERRTTGFTRVSQLHSTNGFSGSSSKFAAPAPRVARPDRHQCVWTHLTYQPGHFSARHRQLPSAHMWGYTSPGEMLRSSGAGQEEGDSRIMWRCFVVPIAVALLLAGCAQTPLPVPTSVVRPTERPVQVTLVPTFTDTAQPVAIASGAPSPAPPATLTTSPTARPSATATPTVRPHRFHRLRLRRPRRQRGVPGPCATPSPVPAPGGAWQGEYFGNPDLNGQPALVRYDGDIDFDWGPGSPDPSVPADHFSVRWTRSASIPAGNGASMPQPTTASGCTWMACRSSTSGIRRVPSPTTPASP